MRRLISGAKDVVLRSEKLSSQDIFIFRHLFGMMFVRCFRSLQVFETAQQVVKWLLFKSELENHPNISWLFQGYTHFFATDFLRGKNFFLTNYLSPPPNDVSIQFVWGGSDLFPAEGGC